MAERVPAQAFPPGEYIRDELEARGWTQADLANVMGRPVQLVNELVSGKKGVTPETAIGLGQAFGTSAEVWMNLDSAYRLWVAHQKEAKGGKPAGEVAKRAKLYAVAPIKDMVKRQWIPEPADADGLEAALDEFFGCKVLEEDACLPLAPRKSTAYGAETPAQRAWAFRARRLARSVGAARFDRATLVGGLRDLHRFTASDAAARHVPRVLSELGVRLVVVEHLPKSRIDGAAFWLDESGQERPVVALSVRFDRIDNFWFTLAHELAHIVHGDLESVDDDLVGAEAVDTDTKPEAERRADRWAANYLLADTEIESFILRVKPYYSKVRINQFANRVKVHPGVIVGQLQRRKEIPYTHSREMLVKVRDTLLGSVMADGWGHTPAIE